MAVKGLILALPPQRASREEAILCRPYLAGICFLSLPYSRSKLLVWRLSFQNADISHFCISRTPVGRCHSGPPTSPTPHPLHPPPPFSPSLPAYRVVFVCCQSDPHWNSFSGSAEDTGGQGGARSNHNGHNQTQNDPEGTEHYRHGGSLVKPSLMYSLIHPGIQGTSE